MFRLRFVTGFVKDLAAERRVQSINASLFNNDNQRRSVVRIIEVKIAGHRLKV